MTTKPLLLLTALTLYCCISTLHAAHWGRCECIRKTSAQIPLQAIKKIEVMPVTGKCRRVEIMITKKNGHKICVNPDAKWVIHLLSNLRRHNETLEDSTSVSPTLDFTL